MKVPTLQALLSQGNKECEAQCSIWLLQGTGALGMLEQVFLSFRAVMEVVANSSRTNPAFISTYFSGETITHSTNTELLLLG